MLFYLSLLFIQPSPIGPFPHGIERFYVPLVLTKVATGRRILPVARLEVTYGIEREDIRNLVLFNIIRSTNSFQD